MLAKQWISLGATCAFFGVALGAFGAHALKKTLPPESLSIYHTAVQYQMIHALALLILGLWAAQNPGISTQFPGSAFSAGIFLFSGSLYILALTRLPFIGIVTPFGGLCFLAGWIGFAFIAWKA